MGRHSGPGKGGYSRGRREKSGTGVFGGKSSSGAGDYSEVALGHMSTPNLMGFHVSQDTFHHHRQASLNAHNEAYFNPSRREHFDNSATYHYQQASNADARSVGINAQVVPGAKFKGRKNTFEMARTAGQLGRN